MADRYLREFMFRFRKIRFSQVTLVAIFVATGAIVEIAAVLSAPSQEPGPQFAAAVSRVRVDVIVTDGDGGFVDDLSASDFRVFEDGERVEVLGVQLVDLDTGTFARLGDDVQRTLTSGVNRWNDSLADDGSNRLPSFEPENASGLAAMVYVIDAPSFSQATRARFADAWSRVLEGTSGPRIPKAVYIVDAFGRLEELVPATLDATRLRDAVAELRNLAVATGDRRSRLLELAIELKDENPLIVLGGEAKARAWEFEERTRSLGEYRRLAAICDALWSRQGRTAIVWVSSGLKLMSGGPYEVLVHASRQPPEPSRDAFSPDPLILREQQRLHEAANSANVSIYSIDPELLTESRSSGVDVRNPIQRVSAALRNPFMVQGLDALGDSLRQASRATGGEAFVHATDIEDVLEEVDQTVSRFYVLSYEPLPPSGDGKYHEIRVEVDRPDVAVRARQGYVDLSAAERSRRSIEAAIQFPGLAIDLPTQTHGYLTWRDDTPVVLLAASVDITTAGTHLAATGERISTLEFYLVVHQGDETVTSGRQIISVERDTPGTPAVGARTATGDSRDNLVPYEHEIELAAGLPAYDIRVAVRDPVSGRLGGARFTLEIGPRPAGWHTSDIMLGRLEPSGRIRSVVDGRLLRDEPTAAFIEVYRGQHPVLRGRIFSANASIEGTQGTQLFAVPLRTAGPGTHRGSILLPTTLPAGGYILELEIVDEPTGGQRVARVPFTIVEGQLR